MSLAERLQDSMRHAARARYESVNIPPFTAYFHPSDALVYLNYAIPDGPVSGDASESLRQLRTAFEQRARVPRFEYVDSLAPQLADVLRGAGYAVEAEARLMVCTPDSYTPLSCPSELTISALTSDAPLEEIRTFCSTTQEGFTPGAPVQVSDAEVTKTLADLKDGRALLAKWNGVPVAGGLVTPPYQGTSELAGVATLQAWRGRGIGAALVSRAAQEAFAHGVDVLFLSTVTEEAGRLYERAGFRFLTRMLFMVDAAAAQSSGKVSP
ncbi:GNAT family N-acetyltransferase [Myxococcus sp. 1LA]